MGSRLMVPGWVQRADAVLARGAAANAARAVAEEELRRRRWEYEALSAAMLPAQRRRRPVGRRLSA